MNVVPVLVPLTMGVVATDAVVIRLQHALTYDRGVELHLQAWLHPDLSARIDGAYGMRSEPRVGLLLDGTKVGATIHEPESVPDGSPDRATSGFNRTGGDSADLQLSQSWWLRPVPAGALELVVSWADLDVPETFVQLDHAALREAAQGAMELWPLPDIADGYYGWSAYSPGSGAAYSSGLSLSFDGDDDGDASER